jgi:hypothetical protein
MAWTVDSCILLDIALKDPTHGLASALCLEKYRSAGLMVCPMTLIDITPQFGGELMNVRAFLKVIGIHPYPAWQEADTALAAEGWTRYVALKRSGKSLRRPLADLLIGAWACRQQGLITRNPDDFRPYFPTLSIIEPGEVHA